MAANGYLTLQSERIVEELEEKSLKVINLL
jgi:hypothetical protein